jgi:hypothetical protein
MIEALAEGVQRAILAGGYPVDVTVIEDATETSLREATGALVATTTPELAQACYKAGWGVIGTVDGHVVHTDGSKGFKSAQNTVKPRRRGK